MNSRMLAHKLEALKLERECRFILQRWAALDAIQQAEYLQTGLCTDTEMLTALTDLPTLERKRVKYQMRATAK